MLPILSAGRQSESQPAEESKIPIQYYAPFGDLAETVRGQGWKPTRWNSEFTEYEPGYGLLSSIDLADGKGTKGKFSIKGSKGGKFDLYIKKPDGSVDRTLLQGVNAKDINDYFTNYTQAKDNYGNPIGSNVLRRSNEIQATGTMMDGIAMAQ